MYLKLFGDVSVNLFAKGFFFFKLVFICDFYVGLLEAVSLWTTMFVEVRLLASGSPHTPCKRGLRWEELFYICGSFLKYLFDCPYLGEVIYFTSLDGDPVYLVFVIVVMIDCSSTLIVSECPQRASE